MGYIPQEPGKYETSFAQCPWFWFGTVDRTGTASPWLEAPLASMYIYQDVSGDDATLYLKITTSATGNDNEWEAQA